MNKYLVKQGIKYGILLVVLIFATIIVYHYGKQEYLDYLDRHIDDQQWIRDHINLVEDNKIGSSILRPDMPNDLAVSNDLYQEVITEEIQKLLINNYSIDNPLLIYNPFRLSTTTVNLYFHTGEHYKFEYHVTTESIVLEENITYFRMQDDNGQDIMTNKHFYVLKGFVPGKKNNLLIRILDENNQVIDAENFILNLPSES